MDFSYLIKRKYDKGSAEACKRLTVPSRKHCGASVVFERRPANPATCALATYIRVSTSGQGRSGLGIEVQRRVLAQFAKTEGFEIARKLVEVETRERLGCGVWPIIQFDFTGSVRNRSLEAIRGGSSITEREVC